MAQSTTGTGYRIDTRYPATCFRELSPAWLNYVAALNGRQAPPLDRPFTYLELGCGRAGSTLMHAAALPGGTFHACDFNVDAILEARDRARAHGIANLHLHACSFAELGNRELPRFDYIVAHGVYSWVGVEERAQVCQLVGRLLADDGVMYLSYNCEPGWSAEAPLRRLLQELTRGAGGDLARALADLEELKASELLYFRAHPAAARAVDAYLKSPLDYLAHEFLNETWQTFYSVDIADEMAGLDLALIGSATLPDNHASLIVDEEAARAIAALAAPRARQLAMDFAVNRQFRRDLFARPGPRDAGLHQDAVIGSANPLALMQNMRVPRGQLGFNAGFIEALRALLPAGGLTVGEWIARLAGEGREPAELGRNLHYLVAAGALEPYAFRHEPAAGAFRFATPVLHSMIKAVAQSGKPGKIAAPALGGAIDIDVAGAEAAIDAVRRGANGRDPSVELLARVGVLVGA